jgi:predicted DNA-binding transcriptional regulator AlpA
MHILRTSDVTRLTGLSRTTLWRLERQGKFPTRIRLGTNSVGWRDEEVQHWVETRPRGMTHPDASHRWTADRQMKDEKQSPEGSALTARPLR